jgi:hypothetical protein
MPPTQILCQKWLNLQNAVKIAKLDERFQAEIGSKKFRNP